MAPTAWALTGDEILGKAEQAMNAPKDRVATERMTLVDSDGSTKERVIEVYQKGSEKRLAVFRSPSDVDGVGFLSLSDDRMYLYLPAFHKVRRIASSAKNEDFMGTDFSYEDMAETEYTKKYVASLEGRKDGTYQLALTPKPGAVVSYARQKMWVDESTFIPVRTEYYAADGTLLKVLTAEAIEKIDGYWFPKRMAMKTEKTGHRTVLEMNRIKHDSGLADRFFTERNLKKQGR